MAGAGTRQRPTKPKPRKFNFWNRLKEIDLFFEGRGREHKTMRRLVKKLEKAKIPYAIMGGMAVNAHKYERTTKDVDVLLTREGFEKFRERFVPRDYDPDRKRSRRFHDRGHRTNIDILITGLFPGSGKPGPVAFPDPADVFLEMGGIRFVDLITLIQLKLAARRHQDFADVVNLINAHNLDDSFVENLHTSLRSDYIECLEEKRREDEYLERNG
jgi:hypothetical protein